MPSSFDTAIPDLIEVCEGSEGFAGASRACIVRDLRGRLRLVVDAPEDLALEVLDNALRARMGAWFHGPVLNARASQPQERRLATTIVERASTWPRGWPRTREDATGVRIAIGERWRGYQRVLSKQSWLDSQADSGAWPLQAGDPSIVAFYSFKGGVGRSTLLGVVAWQLALAGQKVICIDLDLEAPGLAGLFDVAADESVMDHLLAHAATGQAPGPDPVSWTRIHGATIGVVPAGRVGRSYIEKLARLDYLGTAAATQSPVARALAVLLDRVKGQHSPNYILLDCRAGLHDLGGLSLTDVAHLDVLVGRDTPQGREGLALTLDVLAARRSPVTQRVVIAQTMVPLPMDGEVARMTRSRFRVSMYEACKRTLYSALEDEPAEDDDGVAHYPWPIGLYDELAACEHLAEVSPALLASPAFGHVRSRIEALGAPDAEGSGEE